MKRLMIACIAAVAALLTGCKSVPTPEQAELMSKMIGVSAAAVANAVDIDNVARAEVAKIVAEVKDVVPSTNETFSSAWTPVATEHVQKLVDAKKITDAQATMIVLAFDVAMKGADYIFDVRYPEARQYANVVEAAAHGFCDGFLSTFNTSDAMSATPVSNKMDDDAYIWLKHRCKVCAKK